MRSAALMTLWAPLILTACSMGGTVPPAEPTPTEGVEECGQPSGSPELPTDLPAASAAGQVAAYLNDGGSVSALSAWAEERARLVEMFQGKVLAEADFDGDTRLDIALVTPAEPFEWLSIILLCRAGRYELAHFVREGPEWRALVVHRAHDLDADGRADLLVGRWTCGAHTCFDQLQVLMWRDEGFENRFSGASDDLPYPDIGVRDPVGGGSNPIVVTGTGIGSVGAGPYRPRERVWDWDAAVDLYQVSEDRLLPAEYRVHALHDADQAYRERDMAAARELYQRVMEDGSLLDWEESGVRGMELAGYARFRMVLVSLIQGDVSGAELSYNELRDSHPAGSAGAGFAQMGAVFWEVWEATGKIEAACAAARAFADAQPELVLRPLDYGYANPTYTAEDICPWVEAGGS